MCRAPILTLCFALLSSTLASERDAAVARARAGDFATAVPALRGWFEAGDLAAGADLVAVLTWARRPAEALEIWSRLPPSARPAWVQSDVARALGQLGGGLAAAQLVPGEDEAAADFAAASLVRLIAAQNRDPATRFAAADRAIAALDARLAAARAALPPDADRVRRLTFDRWRALLARERARDIVRESESADFPLGTLPGYARALLGGALLQLRRPGEAVPHFRAALSEDPEEWDYVLGLFYALVESEDFAAAYALIDARTAAESATVRYAGDGAGRDNPRKVGAAVTAALGRLYADELEEAWRRLAPLAVAAPANSYLRREAAAVMQARGWLDRAAAELARAEALAPGEFANRIARADLALARRDFADARVRLAGLARDFPDTAAVMRLVRSQTLADQAEVFLHATTERGDSPDQRGTSWRVLAEAWSPRFATHWKAAALWLRAKAAIPEGHVRASAPAAALQRVTGNSEGELRVGQLSSERDRLHARLRLRHRWDDHWTFDLVGARGSTETPLRALHYGISFDSAEASARWSAHESREAALDASAGRFTSGNVRRALALSWRERVVDRPSLDVDLRLDAARQTNSRRDEPYYNPASLLDAGATFTAQHLISRHYDRRWAQHASVRFGWRDEQGFSGGPLWSVRYEMRRDFSEAASISLGAATGRARYDGVAERFVRGELTIYARF